MFWKWNNTPNTLLHFAPLIQVDFTYKVMEGNNLLYRGEPLHVEPRYLHRLALPNYNFVNLDNTTVKKYVFVTAATRNHFEESLDCIGSIQKHFPGHWIVFYDLGLLESQAQKVSKMVTFYKFYFTFNIL